MPIRYDIEPGGEYLLPFAKKKLAELRTEAKNRNLRSLQKRIMVDSGSSISLSTQASFGETTQDSIRVAGGVQYMFTAPIFSDFASANTASQRQYTSFKFSGGSFVHFSATSSLTNSAFVSSLRAAISFKNLYLAYSLLEGFSQGKSIIDYMGNLFVQGVVDPVSLNLVPSISQLFSDASIRAQLISLLLPYTAILPVSVFIAPVTISPVQAYYLLGKTLYITCEDISTISGDTSMPPGVVSAASIAAARVRRTYGVTKNGWILLSESPLSTTDLCSGSIDNTSFLPTASGVAPAVIESYSSSVSIGTYPCYVFGHGNSFDIPVDVSTVNNASALSMSSGFSSSGLDYVVGSFTTISGVTIRRLHSGSLLITPGSSDAKSDLSVISDTEQSVFSQINLAGVTATGSVCDFVGITEAQNAYRVGALLGTQSFFPTAIVYTDTYFCQYYYTNPILALDMSYVADASIPQQSTHTTGSFTLKSVNMPMQIFNDVLIAPPLGRTAQKVASLYNMRTGGFIYADVSDSRFSALQAAFLNDPTGTTTDSAGNRITKLEAVLAVVKIVYSRGIPERLAAFLQLGASLILV